MNISLLKKAPGYNNFSSEASVTCVMWGRVIQRYNRDAILAPFCFYRILPKSMHTYSKNIDKITGVFVHLNQGA
jgi:hypothetical protein